MKWVQEYHINKPLHKTKYKTIKTIDTKLHVTFIGTIQSISWAYLDTHKIVIRI